ncbi:hypothetical protein DAEQUDRAFT_559354 [Daedalea quercina L-15889]|uniref:F-box domain-containing protein n=1 Tax=Daedalea quercina L-15889 TaxID=1314783 RepID=A0A165M038_9APHY|nr:hypothetical protein DAEQUDRAFT_559354 [Daedalea quercina L-15889]
MAEPAPTREAINDRAAHHHSCIITLKTQLNTICPISVLPPEVLSEVFLHRAADWRVKKPYIPVVHDWLPLSHVCKHWRSVALGCPALWSSLKVTGSCEWMAELLARSKRLPLTVYIISRGPLAGSSTSQPPNESIELVLSSLERIRVLSITSIPGRSETSFELLDGPAPLLNSLSVSDLSSYFTSELHLRVHAAPLSLGCDLATQ